MLNAPLLKDVQLFNILIFSIKRESQNQRDCCSTLETVVRRISTTSLVTKKKKKNYIRLYYLDFITGHLMTLKMKYLGTNI